MCDGMLSWPKFASSIVFRHSASILRGICLIRTVDLESCVFIVMETRIVKVLKRNKYKYGVWWSVAECGKGW